MTKNFEYSRDQRISGILNAIMEISAGNYQIKLLPSEKKDEIDAIMVGLNMFVEEIKATRYILEELLRERTNKLAQSEIKYSTLADSASEQIFIINREYRFEYMNTAAAGPFHASPGDLIGKKIDELFPPEQLKIMKTTVDKVFDTGEAQYDEREFSFNNISVWLSTSLAPIYSPDKTSIISVLGISRDTTARKRAGEMLKKQNEELTRLNAEKDKFFSIIAHDLKSPFNGFLNLTEIMANTSENISLAEFTDYSKQLNEAARNLYQLLENLLKWSQVQKGNISYDPVDSDLSQIVIQCIDTINPKAEQKEIKIVNEVDASQKVRADERMLGVILRNFLSNAVKFTRPGGEIFIRSRLLENGTVEISVSDNGIGIPRDDINRLFKIGEKVGREGTEGELSTGLGLLLCKEFVEKNGGEIRVESEENVGSTFSFTLPIVK